MALSTGTRLGPYEIVALIGAGGMGQVYRARDTRLDRTVAIKVLPPEVAGDEERRRRFEREARAVSSLSHPHICSLFDVGRQDETDFLVMEYLEGETLAVRLERGALRLDQVIQYGIQIAGALAAAHRRGFTHRDLKPGNIMLTKAGAKLLDFGLVRPAPETSTEPLHSSLPTKSRNLTVEGSILGTLQYMSPEQLEGKPADARSDIFAFGTVLYEMASGRKAFEGGSQASVIASILSREPAPLSTPHLALDRIIRTCLAKDPDDRWQSARDLALELQWHGGAATVQAPMAAPSSRRREAIAWTVAVAAVLASLALVFIQFRREPAEPLQFFITAPEKTVMGEALTLSPDGRRLAFPATTSDGQTLLWMRPLDSLAAQPLPGTEGAAYPFWSPDSRSVAFFAQAKLKKIDVFGGQPQSLCDAGSGAGGAWSREGVIVFSGGFTDVLYRVSERGGEPAAITTLDASRQEISHTYPYFLPNGRQLIYLVRSRRRENNGIYAARLDNAKTTRRLLATDLMAVYAATPSDSSYLLFLRGATLIARPFNPRTLDVAGEGIPVADQVEFFFRTGMAPFTASANGVLAYRRGSVTYTQPTWYDRTGKQLGTIGQPAEYRHPWLSPDEKRLTIDRLDWQTGNRDIWMLDLERGNAMRFTFDPAVDRRALWSPDGTRVAFAADREGKQNLYVKASNAEGAEEVLLESADTKYPMDWSADGKFITLAVSSRETKIDLWVLPLGGDRKPFPFLRTQFNEDQGRFSPDGRWIAYTSDESGRPEVYVRPFHGAEAAGAKWQISTGGGGDPRWRRDGQEIFYISSDKKLMAAEVRPGSNSSAGIPRPLFEVRVSGLTDTRTHYFISADGQRILVNTLVQSNVSSPITVAVNWHTRLAQRR